MEKKSRNKNVFMKKVKNIYIEIDKNLKLTGIFQDDNNAIHYIRNGKFHREDGPASEFPNGTKWWFWNNLRHNSTGPAIVWYDGSTALFYYGERAYDYKMFWDPNWRKIVEAKVFL